MSQILDPVKLLADYSNPNDNGKIEVSNDLVRWNIYIEQGQIKCAANSTQRLMTTLDYHLRLLGLQNAAAATKSIPASSQSDELFNWLEGGRIIPSLNWLVLREYIQRERVEDICISLTKEALETLLWIRQGEYKWVKNNNLPQHALAARITFQNLAISPMVKELERRLISWQNLDTSILSPYQCPYLAEPQKLDNSSSPILLKLAKFLKGLNFRQLALILNQDELKIAKLLQPFIDSGEIKLEEPAEPWNALPHMPLKRNVKKTASSTLAGNKKKIACIDDSPTILAEMQRFLGDELFEIVKIEDPLKAAPILLRLKPDLILMDISMPEINGYKLCGLFRGSASMKTTPIIMVSGRTGFVDKTRAKLVGATDYLTKPFTQTELLSVVHKYLKPGVST